MKLSSYLVCYFVCQILFPPVPSFRLSNSILTWSVICLSNSVLTWPIIFYVSDSVLTLCSICLSDSFLVPTWSIVLPVKLSSLPATWSIILSAKLDLHVMRSSQQLPTLPARSDPRFSFPPSPLPPSPPPPPPKPPEKKIVSLDRWSSVGLECGRVSNTAFSGRAMAVTSKLIFQWLLSHVQRS